MTKMKKNILHFQAPNLPPYTLPTDGEGGYIRHCPDERCAGHIRFFAPYWRLNEHMKTDHGWPRKSLQPDLDRRKNGRMKHPRSKTDPNNPGSRYIGPEPVPELDDLPSKSSEYRLAHPKKRRRTSDMKGGDDSEASPEATNGALEHVTNADQTEEPDMPPPAKKRRQSAFNLPSSNSQLLAPTPQAHQAFKAYNEKRWQVTVADPPQKAPAPPRPRVRVQPAPKPKPQPQDSIASDSPLSEPPQSNPSTPPTAELSGNHSGPYPFRELPVTQLDGGKSPPRVVNWTVNQPDSSLRVIASDFLHCVAPSTSTTEISTPYPLRHLKHLLDSDKIRVNCILTRNEAKDIATIYSMIAQNAKLKSNSRSNSGPTIPLSSLPAFKSPAADMPQFTGQTQLPSSLNHTFQAYKPSQAQINGSTSKPNGGAASNGPANGFLTFTAKMATTQSVESSPSAQRVRE